MKKDSGVFQKLFGTFGSGISRQPLHTNIVGRGVNGYNPIGGTGKWSRGGDRESPLLGNASPSTKISGYYNRLDELRSYRLIDIVELSVNFYSDYARNFLNETAQQVVTIYKEEGEDLVIDQGKTDIINDILTKQLNIFDYINQHMKDFIYYGQYASALLKSKDETGHSVWRFERLQDPISVITKKVKDFKEGTTKETYLCRSDNGKIYECDENNIWILGSDNLDLENDMASESKKFGEDLSNLKPSFGKVEANKTPIDMILNKESYSTAEPLFYTLILKLKELVIKELLVSLISLRDLSSTQLFLLQFDKSTPMETANELCARTTKLANNTNELASFLTAQFDIVSFLENVLTSPSRFVPDFNSSISNKNSMLPLDKLSDKLLDVMQTLDQCRTNILNPLGLPQSVLDSTSGNKWMVLSQSERASNKVASVMTTIRESVLGLTRKLYNALYQEDINPSYIKLHVSEKTSVEYNNQINQSESIQSLMNGITGVVQSAIQTIDASAPLIDTKAFLGYVQNMLKDIDPDTETLISEETIEAYVEFAKAKLVAMAEQQGIDPSIFEPKPKEEEQL